MGDSLLEDALKELFALLNSEAETFFEYAHLLGVKASRKLAEVMSVLESEHLSAELTWKAPNSRSYVWNGKPEEIIRLHGLLARIEEPKQESVTIDGEVCLLSQTGRIEIAPLGEAHKLKIRYPKDRYAAVQTLKLGDLARFGLEKLSHFDAIRQETVSHYQLIDVISIGGIPKQ